MSTLEKLTDLNAKLEADVAAYNEALAKSDVEAMTTAATNAKTHASEYANQAMIQFFETVSVKEDYNGTILRAIKELTYTTKGYKINKEDEKITGMEIVDRTATVDLRKLCKHNGFTQDWIFSLEKFNLLLTLRAATELMGVDKNADKKKKAEFAAVLKTINDSYYMNEKAKELDMGKTPTSNSQICKQLQMVIDKILFVASETDPAINTYKANSHDVAYLLMCYTKKGKGALKVVCAKHTYVERLIVEIIHRILTGKVYGLDYKMVKKD